VRTSGVDVSGNPVVPVRADGDEPLRCCLRNAHAGEALILFGYEPPIGASPVSRDRLRCSRTPSRAPAQARSIHRRGAGRRQVLRAYDARGWIVDRGRARGASIPSARSRACCEPRGRATAQPQRRVRLLMFTVTRDRDS